MVSKKFFLTFHLLDLIVVLILFEKLSPGYPISIIIEFFYISSNKASWLYTFFSIVVATCGGSTNVNGTYFQNSGYPSTYNRFSD